MKKSIQYRTRGTCSRQINVELDDEGKIAKVEFVGGCSGNTQGISALACGMDAKEAAEKMSGIRCGFRDTSCPDQLSLAIKKMLNDEI